MPTREEMREIETSNRLYEEDGVYLTFTIVTKLDSDLPENSQVTFILQGRAVDHQPLHRPAAVPALHQLRRAAWAELLPRAGGAGRTDRGHHQPRGRRHRARQLGSGFHFCGSVCPPRAARGARAGAIIRGCWNASAKAVNHRQDARESGQPRARPDLRAQHASRSTDDVRTRFRTLSRDVIAMSDHASFLGTNVSFILDATLGMVNIDQNNILKIFSVVTVFLLPPSVIGAIYGMNFDHIPWAHESWGFMGALGLMLASALIPYLIFKRRRWL